MKPYVYILFIVGLTSCGSPEPRRPVQINTKSFFKESIERSKKLLLLEEKLIQNIIAKDSSHTYQQSASGSWYYYDVKNETSDQYPRPDDLVTMAYNVLTFDNDTIYSMQDIGVLKYKVDKQELFIGMRNSVKLLKENETATFWFPSSLAYGYLGDKNKIGANMPIKSTISIFKIEKQQDSIQN